MRLKGSVGLGRRLMTTFDDVPDVPLSKLVLNLAGGPKAALKTSKSLCEQVPTVEAQYGAHSGATGKESVNATVLGCGVSGAGSGLAIRGKLSGIAKKRPALSLTVVSSKALKGLRVKLPGTLKLASARGLKKSSRVLVGGKKYKKTTVKWAGGKIAFTGAKGTKTKKLQLTLPRGVLRIKHRIKVNSKQTFTVYGLTTAGKLISVKVRLKALK